MRSLILLFLLFAMTAMPAYAEETPRWAAYYGAKEPWESFKDYHVVVFDADRHPQVRPLTGQGSDVLAYLSLVEVQPSRPYFPALRRAGLVIDRGEKLAPIVDIRKPEWMAFVIEKIVPLYARDGFTGLMLDTVDTAAHLEATEPQKYKGMSDAAARTVRHIRMHYPYLKLMMNRGFDILPAVEDDLDMVLAESIYIDSRNLPARPFPPAHYRDVLDMLAAARESNPALVTLSLDYWDMKDAQGVKDIYRRQREAGIVPYVATHDLQTLYAEP